MTVKWTVPLTTFATAWTAALTITTLLHPSGFGFQTPSEPRVAVTSPGGASESFSNTAPLLRSDSSLVLIPAYATTTSGTPLLGLTRADFKLFEDGVEQTIAAFSKEDEPVSLMLVYDSSGSMKNKMRRAYEAAVSLLHSYDPRDEFSLVKFNSKPRQAVPFTTNPELLVAEIARSKPSGSTSLLDAVYVALQQIKAAHNRRKGIVIVSDGGDNWSRHSMKSVKRLLVESEAQLFAMGVYDTNYTAKHDIAERDGPQLLDALAKQTGGREYSISGLNPGDFTAVAERIGLALRSQYLLGYYPVNKSQDGKYRRVTLSINTSKLERQIRLYYRQGYFAASR